MDTTIPIHITQRHIHTKYPNIKYLLLAYTVLSASMKLISFYTHNNPSSYPLLPLIYPEKTENLKLKLL